MQKDDQVCCPKFDPKPWDGQVHEWTKKKFVKDRVCTFFNIPCNFGSVMKKLDQKLRAAKAHTPEQICLSDHSSKWNMDVYVSVDREVPGANNITLSGKFLSKVYEGPYKDTGKWCLDFTRFVKGKGLVLKKMYMWYTTCPKCAKKYGKNYVVIVGQVE